MSNQQTSFPPQTTPRGPVGASHVRVRGIQVPPVSPRYGPQVWTTRLPAPDGRSPHKPHRGGGVFIQLLGHGIPAGQLPRTDWFSPVPGGPPPPRPPVGDGGGWALDEAYVSTF